MRFLIRFTTIICFISLLLSPVTFASYGAPENEGPVPFTINNHDSGNFSLNLDDAGGGNGGWGEVLFPKGGNNHLNKAWLAIGNSSSVICGGGAGEFSAVDFTLNNPGASFDLNSSANFTGTISTNTLNVHQRAFQNEYQADTVGHDGKWLIVEYTIRNTHSVSPAYDLYLMEYTDWKVNQTTSNNGYLRFDERNMSVIYDKTIDYSYYMATSQIYGDIQGRNAGVYSILLHGGDDGTIYTEMSTPGNDSSDSTDQNWYTDLVADLGDLGPGESSTVAFVFIAGNSTDELNASYDDAVSSYFRPSISTPTVEGGAWKAGYVNVNAVPYDTPPGTIASVEFEYSYNSTDGTNGNWSSCDGSPKLNAPWQISWNTVNATNTTDDEVWVRVRCTDDYGHTTAWQNISVKVDNEPPNTSQDYDGLWHKSDYTITLSADDGTGSGVSSMGNISYRLNGGSVNSVGGSGQPSITTESASNALEYWSVDDVGNEEQPHKQLSEIKLDKQGPSAVQWQLQPVNITQDSIDDVDITIQITDPLSGISQSIVPELKYKLDDEPYSAYVSMTVGTGTPADQNWKFTVQEPTPNWNVYRGTNLTMKLKATDNIGNVRESNEFRELIDNIIEAPVCTLTAPQGGGEWYTGIVDLSAAVQDSDGEVDSVTFQYSLDSTDGVSDGTWSTIGSPDTAAPYMAQWNTVSDGLVQETNVWLRAFAIDDDNIYSSYSVAAVKIDNNEPELTSVIWAPSDLTATHTDIVTVAIRLDDSGAGLDYNDEGTPNATLFPVVSFKIGEGTPSSYFVMTPMDAEYENWQYEIPVPVGGWSQYSSSELVCRFRLYDRLGNEKLTGENSINITPIPLVVAHTPLSNAQEGDKISFKAEVTGGSDKFMITCVLFYKYNSFDAYTELVMIPVLTGRRGTSATTRGFINKFDVDLVIPRPYPSTGGGEEPTLYYYIKANEGTLHTSTHPSTNPETTPNMILISSNVVPMINHDPPAYSMIGEPIIINVDVTDEKTDLNVNLYYKHINGTTYESVAMQSNSVEGAITNYIATISAQNVEGDVVYYFEVYDGEYTVYAPVEYITQPFSVRVYSSDIPKVLHEPVKKVFVGNRILISALAYDNNGLETVILYYRFDGMLEYLLIDMVMKEGDSRDGVYIVEMPKQENPTTIYYYIAAWDGLNTGTYPAVNASTQPLVLLIEDYPNLLPKVVGYSPEPSADIKAGESKVFNVSAIDPDGESKLLTYKWFVDNMPMPDSASPNFTFISGSKDKGMYSIRVQVRDSPGGTTNFSWTLDIQPGKDAGDLSGSGISSTTVLLIIIAAVMGSVVFFFLFIRKRKDSESDLEEPVSGIKQRAKSGKKTREINDGEMDEDSDDHSGAPVGPLPIPMKYDVQDLFLIHANGNLISHIGTSSRGSNDKDILSGMLTAIQDFIKDGFSEGTDSASDEWNLDNLKFGDRNIFIERGDYMYIAAVLKGEIGYKLRNELHDALKTIDLQYSHVLKKWSGRLDNLKGINDILEYKFNLLKPKTKFGPGTGSIKKPKNGPGQKPNRDRHR